MTSIRGRLMIGLLLGLMALLAIAGAHVYFGVQTALAQQFDAALLAEAHAVCTFVKMQSNGEVEAELPQETIPPLAAQARPQYFQIWREDGSVLMRSPALGENNLPCSAAAETPEYADLELPQQHPARAILIRFVPPAEDEDVDGKTRKEAAAAAARRTVTVAVAQDRSELQRIMTVLLSALLGVAAISALGIVAMVAFVVQRGLQPLERVAREAANIDAQTLDFRFSLDGLSSELRPICMRLNDSLERLEQSFQRQRRFTAAAAHELRTPIAELRSLADVALHWDGGRETSLAYFKDAQQIAQQMEGIVTTLLSLARCQSQEVAVTRESVDLAELIRRAWHGYGPAAVERRLAVSFALPEQLLVTTDRTMLSLIVNNLLANAAQYTPIGGAVCCQAEADDAAVTFRVSNETEGLLAADLPHLPEAFWRKDPARSDSLHCGLGLTLVDAYAKVLGGKVALSLPRPEVLCVALELPIGAS
jgi:signal transduction histidine kinase